MLMMKLHQKMLNILVGCSCIESASKSNRLYTYDAAAVLCCFIIRFQRENKREREREREHYMRGFSIIWSSKAVESVSKFNRLDTCDAVLLEDSRGRGGERERERG
jgi:hypothetical protein